MVHQLANVKKYKHTGKGFITRFTLTRLFALTTLCNKVTLSHNTVESLTEDCQGKDCQGTIGTQNEGTIRPHLAYKTVLLDSEGRLLSHPTEKGGGDCVVYS